ncbi:MAG: outer membrane beta-barrel family protein [Bacteroidota bacterium]
MQKKVTNFLNILQVVPCLLVYSLLPGQSSVSGFVLGNDKKPMANANVLLLNEKDSSLVKGSTSNVSGFFSLEKIKTGNYMALISSTGFKEYYQRNILVNKEDVNVGNIILEQESNALNNVIVTGKKPLFEQKIDRMVINVKSSITNTGGTVLEVLEKSPGVTVNRSSGSIVMNGKDGVQVMINGKMNYMPTEAILQMLNGMNASTVEKIELITNPPAKYDAAGNAGYINIVLSQNPNQGFNGSIDLSMGVGNGTNPKASTNFNYRNKQFNIYGNYSYSRLAQLQNGRFYRRVKDNSLLSEIETTTDRDPYQRNHNARIGIDYIIGRKTIIGAIIGGYNNKWEMDAINHSKYIKNGIVDTQISIKNHEINYWKHAMGNLNLMHSIKEGESLSMNVDYLHYGNENPTDYLNSYYNAGNIHLADESTFSGKVTNINIWVSQFDYEKKIGTKSSIQLGAKGASSHFTNNVLVKKQELGIWIPDSAFTANYKLVENIGAAYISIDHNLSANTTLKGGLRYEYTYSNLGSEKQKNIVDRKYGRLFPTFYINHKLNEKNSVNFSYSRRINRPSFNNLAPFLIFIDPKTFVSGNAALQPAITDGIKLGFVTGKFIVSGTYSYISNAIANFQFEIDTNKNTQTVIAANIKKSQIGNLSISIPVNITKWWFSQVNLDGTWHQMKTGSKNGPIDVAQLFFGISGAQNFKLPKRFAIELSGFYQSKSLSAFFGASTLQPFGRLNFALQKKFEQSTLTLGVDDIFSSFIFKTELAAQDDNFFTEGRLQISQRMFKLSYSLNFGSKILKDKRTRITASEEERSRVQ